MPIIYTPPSAAVAAQNGLNVVAGKVELGGVMSHNTAINFNGKTINFERNPGVLTGLLEYDGVEVATVNDVPASVTADNGLTKTGDNIQLGGELTKNTTINSNGKLLVLGNPNGNAASWGIADSVYTTYFIAVNPNTGGQIQLQIGTPDAGSNVVWIVAGNLGTSQFGMNETDLGLTYFDVPTGTSRAIRLVGTPGISVTDELLLGFLFDADYSAQQVLTDNAAASVKAVKMLITTATGFVWP